jgi:hypothetical protein
VSDPLKSGGAANDMEPLNKYEALAILYLQKQQDLNNVSPEEIVGRYIEAHDRIRKEFIHQKEVRKRRLNPLPL